MTHDELLAKIDVELRGPSDNCWHDGARALLAVVELHKPFMYDGRMGKYERCSGCSSEEEWLGNVYPCPTIQAIEKALTGTPHLVRHTSSFSSTTITECDSI